MVDVAGDEDATPAEIVQAGRAVDAVRSGEGVLVAYTVEPGTSEGRSAAAWRLYDDEGGTIAEELAGVSDEGAARPFVYALPDGFLLADADGPWWHVGADGARERASRVGGPRAARVGDVPLGVGSPGRPAFFRPSTRSLFVAAPTPKRLFQGWAAADDGTIWMQGAGSARNGPVSFSSSSAGRPWERAASYDAAPGRYVEGLAAVGGRIAVAVLAEGSTPGGARLVGLLTRPAAGAPDRAWEVLRPPREAAGEDWFDTSVTAIDETTALVGPGGGQQYLVDLAGAGWRPVEAPTPEDGWSYEVEGGRIHAFHNEHADAWSTDDGGGSWERLPH